MQLKDAWTSATVVGFAERIYAPSFGLLFSDLHLNLVNLSL